MSREDAESVRDRHQPNTRGNCRVDRMPHPCETHQLAVAVLRVLDLVVEKVAQESEAEADERRNNVRCYRCELRYGERQQYACVIEGTAHEFYANELAEAMERHPGDGVYTRISAVDVLAAVSGGREDRT